MLEIPLSAIPFQELSVVLADQNCTITLRQIAESLYLDLAVDDRAIFRGRICEIDVPINLYRSRFFRGYLFFEDTKGSDNPQYDGLGSRWRLFYATVEELTDA